MNPVFAALQVSKMSETISLELDEDIQVPRLSYSQRKARPKV